MATVETTTTTGDARAAFLAHFPTNRRSTITNMFLHAMRGNGRCAPHVLCAVEYELYQRMEHSRDWPEDKQRYEEARTIIHEHHDDAHAFAEWALAWEKLTPQQKAQRRAGQSGPHIRQWMSTQPPTAKQLAFLEALGHTGEVTSKQEASELIDRLRQRGAVKS